MTATYEAAWCIVERASKMTGNAFVALDGDLARALIERLPDPYGRGSPVVVMPEEPIDTAISAIRSVGTTSYHHADLIYRALYAHLSRPPTPPTRTVNVWHVEYMWSTDGDAWQPAIELYTSEDAARRFARERTEEPWRGTVKYSDIRVTGPHKREVLV